MPRAAPADLLELAKPRIVMLVLVTMAAGYAMAPVLGVTSPAVWVLGLFHALVGTALVAGGTNALNQVFERDVDALMARTARRPLPSARLEVREATVFAWLIGASGVAYLALLVNAVTAILAALTLASYVFVYTPLKRRTPLSTLIGAVPGALPIVGGWTAAGGTLETRAFILFALLFLWQLPHFLALSWIYRDDYARAGLQMLSVGDADGRMTFRQAAVHAAALIPISLAPAVVGMGGPVYFLGAALLSGGYFWASVAAARCPSRDGARRLFSASLIYLPGILALMILDRIA
ncbi:MAG: heme o synthase [Gemmatimonadota bacterium]|nr:heme o synthase [Gemmatimonadota bacterium]